MSILDLYVSVDTFWQAFEPFREHEMVANGRRRRRATRLSPSEIMTILILFQQSGYRTFKGFSTQYVQIHLRAEFPHLLSYTRFVALMPRVLLPVVIDLQTQCGTCSGISFIDSTALRVCHNARIAQHRVFRRDAQRGKTSVGWFYGFKLHLVVNDRGEMLAFCLTPGNVDDRRPVPRLVRRLFGKLFGDRGYISAALAEQLLVTQASSSSPNAGKTCVRRSWRIATDCSCASGRSSKASTMNSRTFARSSIPVTAATTTSSSTSCAS
jgi:DDE family transposase